MRLFFLFKPLSLNDRYDQQYDFLTTTPFNTYSHIYIYENSCSKSNSLRQPIIISILQLWGAARAEIYTLRDMLIKQIQTEPVQQRFVWLNITEAYSMIPGGPDLHVKQGSSLRLECQLMAAAESPSYIFWYRENRMINYDNEPGVRVERTRNGSVLVVEKVKLSHGANYTCLPSNARPAYIMIHVIEGERLAGAHLAYSSFINSSLIPGFSNNFIPYASHLPGGLPHTRATSRNSSRTLPPPCRRFVVKKRSEARSRMMFRYIVRINSSINNARS